MSKHLQDVATRHQVFLERLKAGEVRNFVKAIDKVEKAIVEVVATLRVDNLGQLTRRELTKLLSELKATNLDLMGKNITELFDRLEVLAHDSATFEAKSLESLSSKLALTIPTAKAAYAQAMAQPLSATGQLLEEFTTGWSKGEVTRINNVITRAWGEGWTNQQLVKTIRGTKALGFKDGILTTSRRNAEAVVRTSIQHVASSGRMATWEANRDVVTKYKYVATLDAVTTVRCRTLDGRTFDFGAGPIPPVHINCRSTTVAVLDPSLGLDFLENGATRSAANGPVPAKQTYYEWLKDQPKAFQKEALGETRAKLFQSGGLSAEKFAQLNVGKNFHPLTLDEMRTLAPSAFVRAGIPPHP